MIPYVRDIKFEYGKVDQVSPLIRRVIANNPGPFTFTGTGTYIIGKGEGVAVIDPGPDQPEHLQAILDATQGERITHILITHHHLDHSPLARPLAAATGAVIYGCAVTELPARRRRAHRGRLRPLHARRLGLRRRRRSPGHGWTFEAIPTPGHTSNHICYALAEENACFTGDHIMGWSTTVVTPPDGDMADYLASLDADPGRGTSRRSGRPTGRRSPSSARSSTATAPTGWSASGRSWRSWPPARRGSSTWCRRCTSASMRGSIPAAGRSVLAHMIAAGEDRPRRHRRRGRHRKRLSARLSQGADQ